MGQLCVCCVRATTMSKYFKFATWIDGGPSLHILELQIKVLYLPKILMVIFYWVEVVNVAIMLQTINSTFVGQIWDSTVYSMGLRTKRSRYVTGWTWKHYNFDRLCPPPPRPNTVVGWFRRHLLSQFSCGRWLTKTTLFIFGIDLHWFWDLGLGVHVWSSLNGLDVPIWESWFQTHLSCSKIS